MRTILIAFLFSVAAFVSNGQTEEGKLAEYWFDGYMSEFRDQIDFVKGETPSKIELDVFSNAKKKTIRLKSIDQHIVDEVLDSIFSSVEQLARELNTFDDNGQRERGRISFKPQYESYIRIEWMKNSYRIVLGMEPGALSYKIYEKKGKEPLVVSRKICDFYLFEKIERRLQQGSPYNSGQSLRD